MKTKRFLGFLALFIAITAINTSCSSSDNSSPADPNGGGGDGGNVDPGVGNPPDPTMAAYAHKVLLEDFTGAWCQYCPIVGHDIEEMQKSYPEKFEAVAVHNSMSSDVNDGGHDPYDFDPAERRKLETKLKVTGYPAAYVNRSIDFRKFPESVKTSHQASSPIGIKISSDLATAGGVVNLELKFSQDYTNGLKYIVYIVEDGLIFRQSNNSTYYTPNKGWVTQYVHNNTLRATPNGFEGTELASSITKKGGEFKINNIISTYKSENLDKLRVLVIVTDMAGKTLNVQSAKANTTKDFVIL